MFKHRLSRTIVIASLFTALVGTGFGVWVFVNLDNKTTKEVDLTLEPAVVANNLNVQLKSKRLVIDDNNENMYGMDMEVSYDIDYHGGTYDYPTGTKIPFEITYTMSCYISRIDESKPCLNYYIKLSEVQAKDDVNGEFTKSTSELDRVETIDGITYDCPEFTLTRKFTYTVGTSEKTNVVGLLFPYFTYKNKPTNQTEYDELRTSIGNSQFNFTYTLISCKIDGDVVKP